jgi:hypothetical protein
MLRIAPRQTRGVWYVGVECQFQFEFDPANRLLVCRAIGVVTEESLREFYRLVGKYVVLTQPEAGIADLSSVTSFRASPETIRALAESPPPMSDPKVPRYLVATSDHVYAMCRMFELQGEKTRPLLRVVRTIDEAYALLDIHQPRLEPVVAPHE